MRIAALVSVLLLLIACTPKARQDSTPVVSQNTKICPVPTVEICTPIFLDDIQIEEETAGYIIGINYPVLCSADATRTIRDHVTRSLSDFKKDFPEHDLRDYPVKHEMIVEHAIWPAGNGRLASVKLQVMVYTGGAHPNHWPVTWVFDMTDGEALDLDDIFINEQDALIEIAPMVREVLIAKLGQMYLPDMLDDGTTPVVSNYDDFILNDEGIVFYFAPYQVAPYAAGQQMVTIPYGDVKELLTAEIKEIISVN